MNQRKTKLSRLITLVTAALLLGAWAAVTGLGWVDEKLLPSPGAVCRALVSISVTGYKGSTLLGHMSASLYRLVSAFLLAVLTAVPLGLASGYCAPLRAVFDPIIEFYRPLPPLAYYTLLVLWMGIDNESKIALLYLACFAPIYIACVAAVRKLPESVVACAVTLGAGKSQVFWHVILPYCLPDVFTGLRTALGVGYSTLVAAEMVAAVSGLGWMVLDAANWLRSDVVFAGIIVLGVTGILLDQILRLVERVAVPWKGKA